MQMVYKLGFTKEILSSLRYPAYAISNSEFLCIVYPIIFYGEKKKKNTAIKRDILRLPSLKFRIKSLKISFRLLLSLKEKRERSWIRR